MEERSLKIGCRIIFVLFLIFISACSESSVDPDSSTASIGGSVLYLDGSPGKFAPLQLRKLSSSLLLYTSADENGLYKFDSLEAGDYNIRFGSNNADIHSYEVEVSINESQNLEQNIFILYKKIDEFNALKKGKDVFLIKYAPEGGRIGENHQFVNYLSGTFYGDITNSFTLSCDIYLAPDQLSWEANDSLFTSEFIKQNYTYITSIDEIISNRRHEIRFYGEDIVKLLSNPLNGFIFIKKNQNEKELMIPCVDYNNNDFGLLINYK
jgi:hypothetical protein